MDAVKGVRRRLYVGRYRIGKDASGGQLILHPRNPKPQALPYSNGVTEFSNFRLIR